MSIGKIASDAGKGMFAGLVGTAAMTLSTMIEMRLREREESTTPAEAAGKVLGVKPVGKEEKKRFSNLMHWSYGTAWGAVRGLLGSAGLRGPSAMLVHFGAVWTTELAMLPALEVSKPVTEWDKAEIAIDATHHLVYAVAAGFVYDFMEHHTRCD